MTYSVNQNLRVPANYSGVTINVTNPSLVPSFQQPVSCSMQAPVANNGIQPQALPNGYPSEYYVNNYNPYMQGALPPINNTIQNYNYPEGQNRQQVEYTQAPQLPQAIHTQQNYYNYPVNPTESQNSGISAQNTYPPQNMQQNQYQVPAQSFYPAYDFEQEQNQAYSKEILAKLDKIAEAEQNEQKNKTKKQIVVLTNEYIMSLENFLNNPNKEIRRKGASEVINRLGEDTSRKNDAALNALLNKMLQDPDKGVRTLGLSAFAAGIATGNEYTVQLLKQMEANPQAYPDDMEAIATALLKMTTGTETIYVDASSQNG